MKQNINFIIFNVPKIREEYNFGSVGVFHQQSPCTWSLPCLYEQDTLQANCGRSSSIPQIFTSEGSEPVKPKSKLKTKIGLVEEGDITIRGVITRILIFIAN